MALGISTLLGSRLASDGRRSFEFLVCVSLHCCARSIGLISCSQILLYFMIHNNHGFPPCSESFRRGVGGGGGGELFIPHGRVV